MASSIPEVRTPRAVSFERDRLSVELDDGRTIAAPIDWYPRLQNGDARERDNWEFTIDEVVFAEPGDLDEDISVEGLLAGRRSGEGQRSFQRWLYARNNGVGSR